MYLLAWSTTVVMKIDLVGSRQRGLAMGLNEFAGYLAVAGSAYAAGLVASRFGVHPAPFYLGLGFVAYVAIGLSRHTLGEQTGFEQAMKDRPVVRECHNVTGAFEYLLRVEVADLPAYKRFHADVLGGLPQVSMITSYIVMDSPKDGRG